MSHTIAIVGATGAVGAEVLKILEQRRFPIGGLRLFASARSEGVQVPFRGERLTVHEATPEAFDGVDIAFFAARGGASKKLAPEAAKRGALVIDKSAAWRMDPRVPLVIPEVNAADIDQHSGIISSPNCSTIVMLMALAPLHRANPVRRVIVDTYQSASGAGGKGIVELLQQTRDTLDEKEPGHATFPHPLAFNVLPQVEVFGDDGYTTEELKMRDETRKIMHLPDLPVSATCVRVPVTVSHSEAVHVELAQPMSTDEAREVLADAPGLVVQDDIARGAYPLARDAAGQDEVFVGRVRKDLALDNGLSFWVVGDNLRKGAALNAVQIAEAAIQMNALRRVSAGSRVP